MCLVSFCNSFVSTRENVLCETLRCCVDCRLSVYKWCNDKLIVCCVVLCEMLRCCVDCQLSVHKWCTDKPRVCCVMLCETLRCCVDCQLSVHKWCFDKLLVPCLGGSVRISQRRPLSSTIKMFGSFRPQLPVAAGLLHYGLLVFFCHLLSLLCPVNTAQLIVYYIL